MDHYYCPANYVIKQTQQTPIMTVDFQKCPQVTNKEYEGSLQTDSQSGIERGTWSNRGEVFLTYLGYCIGLGNVWRFPYLCYKSGGGAFLVPYFIMFLFIGLPLYYTELAIGQFSSTGPSKCWKFCPILKGVGYCAVIAAGISGIYYNHLLAYSLLFLFHSMRKELPWATCGNEWNTPNCFVPNNETISYLQGLQNTSSSSKLMPNNFTSAAEEFWELKILKRSSGIDEPGMVDWQLALALALAWVLVFLCMVKGIKSTGKVVYVTAILPIVVLLILLIRGVTLPGASIGLYFYLVPNFNKLTDHRVWASAASQVFYSSGVAWGILINCSSYNKFNHKFNRDAMLVPSLCSLFSIVAGLTIFSTVGFMANIMQQDVSTVVAAGPGLTFVAYPEAIAQMPVAPLWAVLFFLMILTLAIDSMFTTFEVVIGTIVDEFPRLLKWRPLVTAVMCFIWFLIGLPQATQAGMYVLTLLDWYVGTFPPIAVGFIEVFSLYYVYGYKNFEKDVEAMLGSRPNIFWRVTAYISPVGIFIMLVFSIVMFEPVTYADYVYPKWAQGIGIFVFAFPLLCIPTFALALFYQSFTSIQKNMSIKNRTILALKTLVKPQKEWTDRRSLAYKEEKDEKDFSLERLPSDIPLKT